jgi:hypothetical protein
MGFTSSYSCGGLEDKFKVLLRLAGARPDGHVRVVCTSAVSEPQRSSTVLLTFHALVPAAAGVNAATLGVWKDVAWRAGSPRELEAGDCELVDVFARRILPLFTTRVVALPDGSILNRYWDDRDTARDESYREDSELARTSGRA